MKTSLNKNICISLSLGSTHTGLIAASYESKIAFNSQNSDALMLGERELPRIQILGAARLNNNGAIKKGVVSSIEALTSSILEAIDEVERQSGIEIESVRVCIAGSAAQFDNHIESCHIKGEEIKAADLERVSAAVRNQKPPMGYEFIHMIPSSYSVDGKHGIQNPIGMQGSQLSIMHHRVFYPQADLHNIVRSCNNAGIRVQSFAFEPLAAAEGVLTKDEKEFGCISLSIGAHLTHACVYLGNIPVYSKEYPIGSHHITKDLSIGLRTTQAEAERVKKELGKAIEFSAKDKNEKIEICSIDGNHTRFVTRKEINQIIEPRVREILNTIYFDLKRSKLITKTSKGIVLSGGGALLSGMALATEEVFSLHARVGLPVNITGVIEGLKSPIWASGVGTLSPLFASIHGEQNSFQIEETKKIGSFATKIWHKLKEPFASR
ncbi:cell division protein FtsA [Pigmentibacter sp. JX0631]|uniref:cell division protein FtsA n=1 Tax=Pigmentibacter sp. JX0631 TaxID=2976982 RepID=UPI002468E19F|nr:cell division protein FtsA [Pigmentibacter sp. JX0631]WGL61439.1 cell division protein FtsA [Pigmentibacter sp. JX0631]